MEGLLDLEAEEVGGVRKEHYNSDEDSGASLKGFIHDGPLSSDEGVFSSSEEELPSPKVLKKRKRLRRAATSKVDEILVGMKLQTCSNCDCISEALFFVSVAFKEFEKSEDVKDSRNLHYRSECQQCHMSVTI
jgi:hypothetical protein